MSDEHHFSQTSDPGTPPEFQPESQVSSPAHDPRAEMGAEKVIARVPDLERPRTSRRGSTSRWSEGRILSERISMRLLVGAGVVLVILAIALPFLFRNNDGDSQGTEEQSTAQAGAESGSQAAPGWEGDSKAPGMAGGPSESGFGGPQDGFGGLANEAGAHGLDRTPPWSQGSPYPPQGAGYRGYPPVTGSMAGSGRTETSRWDQPAQSTYPPYQYRQGVDRTTPAGWDHSDGFRPGSTGRVPPGLPAADMNRPGDVANGATYEPRTANHQAAYYQHYDPPQATANRPASLSGRGQTGSYDYRRDYPRQEYGRSSAAPNSYQQTSRPDYRAYDSRQAPSYPSPPANPSSQSTAYPRDYDLPGAPGEYSPSRSPGYYGSDPRASYRDPGYRSQPSGAYPSTESPAGNSYGGPRYRAAGGTAETGEPGVARLEGIIQDPSVRTSSYDSARSRVY